MYYGIGLALRLCFFRRMIFSGYLYSGRNISRSHYFSNILDVFQRGTSVISHVHEQNPSALLHVLLDRIQPHGWSLSFFTPRSDY